MNPAVPILGSLALAGLVFFIYCKRTMEGPDAPIVVVDRRTMKLAVKRITAAIEAADYLRADAGLHALTLWLNNEVSAGPRHRRAAYADMLERVRTMHTGVIEVLSVLAHADAN